MGDALSVLAQELSNEFDNIFIVFVQKLGVNHNLVNLVGSLVPKISVLNLKIFSDYVDQGHPYFVEKIKGK